MAAKKPAKGSRPRKRTASASAATKKTEKRSTGPEEVGEVEEVEAELVEELPLATGTPGEFSFDDEAVDAALVDGDEAVSVDAAEAGRAHGSGAPRAEATPIEATPVEDPDPAASSGPAGALVPATPAGALVTTDALSRYLAEIRQYDVLTREEEHEVAVRYHEEGDSEAAVTLVTSNLRLVVMVAREYQRAFHNLLDLIQEGNVGLLEALKQFDPYRGVRFPSYAVWWVRAYIIRYVMNNFRMVKLGTTQAQRRLFFNLQKEKARLESLGFTPTADVIAKNLGVKEREVIEMERRMSVGAETSVDTPLKDDGGGSMMDVLPSGVEDAEQQVAEEEFYSLMRDKLAEFGENLEGREAEIFAERLMAEEPLTLQELGDRYGVSRERVRQMEAAMKKRLRDYLVDQVRDIGEATL